MTSGSREIFLVRKGDGERGRFVLEVFHDGERWTSTLARLDDAGETQAATIAPRFYGLTADQARRRMLTALENEFDEVVPANADGDRTSR